MPNPSTLIRLAEGLTEAQRRFVKGDTFSCPREDFRGLMRAQLVYDDFDEDLFTPDGLALRSYLQRQS